MVLKVKGDLGGCNIGHATGTDIDTRMASPLDGPSGERDNILVVDLEKRGGDFQRNRQNSDGTFYWNEKKLQHPGTNSTVGYVLHPLYMRLTVKLCKCSKCTFG